MLLGDKGNKCRQAEINKISNFIVIIEQLLLEVRDCKLGIKSEPILFYEISF